jgi:hypothetical protein
MLKSYEAIYEQGQMKWLADQPQVTSARVIVTIWLWYINANFERFPSHWRSRIESANQVGVSPSKSSHY